MDFLKKGKALLLVSMFAVQGVCGAVGTLFLEEHYDPQVIKRFYLGGDQTLQEMYDRAVDEIKKDAPDLVMVNTLLDAVRRCRRGVLTQELNDLATEQLMWLSYVARWNQRSLELIDSMSVPMQQKYAALRGEIVGLLQNESMGTLDTSVDSQMTIELPDEGDELVGNILDDLRDAWDEGF